MKDISTREAVVRIRPHRADLILGMVSALFAYGGSMLAFWGGGSES